MKKFAIFCMVLLLGMLPAQAYATEDYTTEQESTTGEETTGRASSDEALPEFPELVSDKMIVMDADSGEVLYHLNGDVECYPASTTKLLTALLTIENCAMDEVVTYSEAAVDSIEYGDANATISVGEQLTVEQSLYCLLLRSANDAAYGLAEHVAGTVSNFAAMMNARAELIGCTNTHFTNASGLHDSLHHTTPYDMALIARNCMQNKTLMSILNYTNVYMIPPTNTSTFTRYYTHRYAMVSGGAYAYPYSLGGKTGYTTNAEYCLVSYAQKDDLRLIIVIMDSTDDGRYLDTINIFNYYFDHFHKVYLSEVNTGLSSDSSSILALTQEISSTHNVSVGFDKDAYLLVPNSYEADELTGIVTYADNAAYTGKEGGFASITYYVDNFNVGSATLYITQYDSLDNSGLSGVPLRTHRMTTVATPITYINVWIIVGIAFLGLGIAGLLVFIIYRQTHKRGRKKQLRF